MFGDDGATWGFSIRRRRKPLFPLRTVISAPAGDTRRDTLEGGRRASAPHRPGDRDTPQCVRGAPRFPQLRAGVSPEHPRGGRG